MHLAQTRGTGGFLFSCLGCERVLLHIQNPTPCQTSTPIAMCTIRTSLPYDRPAVHCDLNLIKRFYPKVSSHLLDKVWNAATDNHVPKPAVLVLLAELAHRRTLGIEDWGNEYGPTLAFSAMDMQTSRRWQTPTMEHVHDTMISFSLGERNVGLVREVFEEHGFSLAFFCDCGCGAPTNRTEFFGSELYQDTNLWRSWAEANGHPVTEISGPDDRRLSDLTLDMSPQQFESYDRIAQCLARLHKHEPKAPEAVTETMSRLFVQIEVPAHA